MSPHTKRSHRQYEALRAYYVEGLSASEVAERFGYSYAGFRVMLHKVNKKISGDTEEFDQYFFNQKRVGRKPKQEKNQTDELIIQLRKKYLSVPDIKAILDTLEYSVCETYIYKVLKSNGFAELNQLPLSDWHQVRVHDSTGKGRVLSVNDRRINLRDYGGELRQVAITGHGRIKPALILTNDFELTCSEVIRKYARRWLVEKDISQQIEFFHFNRISSSMVIKVDFDLTMSILANNLLRLFATDLPGGYSRLNAESLYTKFLQNSGRVKISNSQIEIMLRKKRNLPAILSATQKFREKPSRIFDGRRLIISGDSRS